MSTRKKICLIIPSLGVGGMERVMSELANYFHSLKKYDVHLIVFGIKRNLFYTIGDGIFIHKPDFVFNNKFRLFHAIKTMVFIRRTVKKIEPDTLLSFGEIWNSFVLLSLYGYKYPVYISDRCKPDKVFSLHQEWLRKFLYPKATGIIVQTKKALHIYKKKFKNNYVIAIGNPVRHIAKSEKQEKEKIVLSVGRLIDTKHFDRLINIFLKASDKSWKLIIIGDDAIKQNNLSKLKALVKQRKAETKILLTGTRRNVDEYYLKSEIFAFTSSSEGYPNVIGEAMVSGLPVVAYDCIAGPSELIDDGENGFLIPLFDDDTYEKKLKQLMDNSELRKEMGKNARIKSMNSTIDQIGSKYLSWILPE